jgi:drug/metabolite transporter (DMT)-like permease
MALDSAPETRAPRSLGDTLAVDAALLLVVVMWAATFSTFKVAWREVDPVAFTGVRFLVITLVSFAVLAARRERRRPSRADLPTLALSGLLGYFLYQMGFVLGLDRTSAVASAILISTHPMFALLFSWLGGRERPTRMGVLGLMVGFAGVVVFLGGWSDLGNARVGDLLSLGAAACFGAYGAINQGLSTRFSGPELMAYTLAVGGTLIILVSAPAMAAQDWSSVGATTWLIIVFAIFGPVYAAYALWNWAIHKRGIQRTVVYAFLVPVVGGVMAVVWLHERLGARQVFGAVLVVAGLVVSRLGPPAQVARAGRRV